MSFDLLKLSTLEIRSTYMNVMVILSMDHYQLRNRHNYPQITPFNSMIIFNYFLLAGGNRVLGMFFISIGCCVREFLIITKTLESIS